MNGRIYDPQLGRFLSADPVIDGPLSLQGYNRYSYVHNNPLTYNDPDGHFLSVLITVGFAAYDTYNFATGKISGTEYAANMALNGAALVADVATAGTGGGMAVRAGNAAIKAAKFVDKADTVYSAANGMYRTAESINDGDVKGALLNGTLAAVGAKTAAGGSSSKAAGKLDDAAPDAKKLDAVDSKSKKAEQLKKNKAQGEAAEAQAKTDLEKGGNSILGSQVTIRTSEGNRRIDHLVQTPDGTIKVVEVKSGNASRNKSQKLKDNAMATEGVVIVGKNAPKELRGQELRIETEERRY